MNKFKLFIISGLLAFFGITSFCSAIEILDNFSVGLGSTSIARGLTSVSSNGLYYNYYKLSSPISSLYTGYIMNASFGDTSSSNALYGDVINAFYCPYNQSINSTTVQNMFNGSICEFIGTGVIGESSSKYFINDTKNYSIIFITDGYSTSNGTVSSVYIGSSSYGRYELWNNYIKNREGYIKSSACPSQFTSLQCQTEYNLIPIEDITANYCKINFDLIDPSECQGNNTGETIYSNLYINNTRYPGASNIYLRTNDSLGYTYNNTGGQIEVNVDYNVDEDYLIDVINKEKLTPTNGDFENLINGLQYYIPYIMVALLLGRTVYILKKVFRF